MALSSIGNGNIITGRIVSLKIIIGKNAFTDKQTMLFTMIIQSADTISQPHHQLHI